MGLVTVNGINREHRLTTLAAYLLLVPRRSESRGILLPTEAERESATGLLLLESPSLFWGGYLQSVIQSSLYDVGASEMQQRVDPIF